MSLLDDPLQLVVIGIVFVVFIMWGPKKIPELARALGQAKREFNAGSLEAASPAPQTTANLPSKQQADGLVDAANKLGIPTEGKTSAEISEAILAKASRIGG